jgi:hypothetical protein
MSVIAKFVVRTVEDFGTGKLTQLGCWCDNDMMAENAEAKDHKDKLFTKYSPSGDMKLSQPQYCQLGQAGDYEWDTKADAFYVMMLNMDELRDGFDTISDGRQFPGSSLAFVGTCLSVTDLGYSKQVVFTGKAKQSHIGMDKFRWQMTVDNPGASNQFKPGHDVWIVFYPCSKYTRDEAIHDAHAKQGA